jgi:hypothetical protein
MARKSRWSELQRERDRRERVARAQERTQQQLIRQMAQDRQGDEGTSSMALGT